MDAVHPNAADAIAEDAVSSARVDVIAVELVVAVVASRAHHKVSPSANNPVSKPKLANIANRENIANRAHRGHNRRSAPTVSVIPSSPGRHVPSGLNGLNAQSALKGRNARSGPNASIKPHRVRANRPHPAPSVSHAPTAGLMHRRKHLYSASPPLRRGRKRNLPPSRNKAHARDLRRTFPLSCASRPDR